MWMSVVLVLLLGVAAFAVDIGHAYYVGEQAQNAADAAALSGAAFLPQDCSRGPFAADERARAIAADNKFDAADPATTVTIVTHCDDPGATGPRPNQIRVDVAHKVDTFFGRIFGISSLTVRRKAVGEFDPPINLGSPVSNFGSAPDCAGCFDSQMWASISAQLNDKSTGNAITMGWCQGSADNCPAGGSQLNNSDADPNGELFEIDNRGVRTLSLHLYDPAFIDTNDYCDNGRLFGKGLDPAVVLPPQVWGGGWSIAHPGARFQPGLSQYCTGDNTNGNGWLGANARGDASREVYEDGARATDTTYTLYPLVDSLNPLGASPICSYTYNGYWGPANIPRANPPDAAEQTFHQWDDFTSRAGCGSLDGARYVLQVRTRAQTVGTNNFSIAACGACSGSPNRIPAPDNDVTVTAITKMALYTHAKTASGKPTFYLARVPSWAAGETLTVAFYDIGDADIGTGPLDLRILDARTGAEFTSCTFADPTARGVLSNRPSPWDQNARDTDWGPLKPMGGGCSAHITGGPSGNQFRWNGKWIVVHIPIPATYTCADDDFRDCWFQIQYDMSNPSAQLFDTTTWYARLSANPVRLVK